jgi:hypothetical protein
VKLFVNPPPNTTPSGIGFQLPNPEQAGKLVFYEDCRLTTGMMAEAKGLGYDGLLGFDEGMESVIKEWWYESGRQIAASYGRPVRWYFGATIENNVARDQFGEPDPHYGYDAIAFTRVDDRSRSIHLWINAGAKHDGQVWLQTGAPKFPVDLSIVTYPIFKGALLALVANWPLPWISAHAFRSNYAMVPVHGGAGYLLESRPMLPQEPTFPRSPFEIPWIGYLSADLAAGVKLSPEIATGRAADGGLLMITTEDRLDPDNPEHLRRARIIAETMIACTGYQSDGTARA